MRDVTLLARGNWAAEIKRNGLRIKDKFSPRTSVSHIPVVTELAPDAKYDVFFVVLRYTQLDSALDTLRANRTKNIVFVGNNVQTKALAAALPEKNVLFAFALSAGHREADRVISIDLKKITIGQLTGAKSNKQLIGRIFHGTKYKVVYEPNMEDYLLCHAAFVMPAAFACYKTDSDLKKLRGDTAYLNRDLKKFFDEHGAAYPVWHLRADEGAGTVRPDPGFVTSGLHHERSGRCDKFCAAVHPCLRRALLRLRVQKERVTDDEEEGNLSFP